MRLSRIYVQQPLARGQRCELPAQAAHHVARVLRLRPGDPLVLFNGTGLEFDACVHHVSGRGVGVEVLDAHRVERESPLCVRLGLALSRGRRIDVAIQKAVELGVAHITPLATARSVVRLDTARAEARSEHWRGIVVDACEQCGRNRVPETAPVADLGEWFERERSAALGLALSPGAATPLASLAPPRGTLALLVGPEGGLSPEERARARAAGFREVSLGPRVLRTETAVAAALTAAQVLWGDLGASGGAP